MSLELLHCDVLDTMIEDVQTAALLLAMSNSIAVEEKVKQIILKKHYKSVVTEFGGNEEKFKKHIANSVIGAALNREVVEKTSGQIHSLLHAVSEASKGFLLENNMETNLAVKIAIVRDGDWISVAFVGYSALHYSTNHKRAGLGTMHIGV